MATFLLKRLGLMVLTLWLLTVIVFFAGQILPGDPARATLGNLAAPSAVQALDHQLGVDRPLLTRYLSWLGGLLHGNLGTSYSYQTAVEPFIRAALINSVKLAVLAFVIVVPLGIFGGVIAALYAGRGTDRAISVTGLSLSTVPEFVSGIVLIVVFGVELKWLPVTASAGPGASALEQFRHLILPAIPLVFVLFGYIARMARAGTIDVLNSDYTRTAVLKGLPRTTVIRRHVLRNSLLPTITVIATQTGYLIGGLVVVETLFNYQGLGNLIYKAALTHDFPMLEAGVLIIGVVYVVATLIADLLLTWLNPRLRMGGSRMSGSVPQPAEPGVPSAVDPVAPLDRTGGYLGAAGAPRWRPPAGPRRPGGSCCCAGRRSTWARASCCSGWSAPCSATCSRRTTRSRSNCCSPTPPRPRRTGSVPTRSAATCCPGSSPGPGTS